MTLNPFEVYIHLYGQGFSPPLASISPKHKITLKVKLFLPEAK